MPKPLCSPSEPERSGSRGPSALSREAFPGLLAALTRLVYRLPSFPSSPSSLAFFLFFKLIFFLNNINFLNLVYF